MEQDFNQNLRTFANGTFRLVEDRSRQGAARKRLLLGLNVASLGVTVALVLLGLLAVRRVNGCIGTFSLWTPVALLLGTLALVLLHEVLHALAARWFGKAPRGTVRIGFDRRILTAFSVSDVPLPVMAFRQGTLLPLWVCALLPMAVGLLRSDAVLWTIGAVMAGGSVADLWYIWDLRAVPAGRYILELPPDRSGYAVGVLVYERADSQEGCEAADILQSDFPERILEDDGTLTADEPGQADEAEPADGPQTPEQPE